MQFFQARKDVVATDCGGEKMIFDPVTRNLHVLNKSAACLWDLLNGKRDLKKLAQELKKVFQGAEADVIAKDIAQTIKVLEQKKLLKGTC